MSPREPRRKGPASAYRRLLANVFLFGLGSLGSRVLVFLLTPFYTSILSQTEYGVTDLLIQTGNFLLPLASLGIGNAVLRFGAEERMQADGAFTAGLMVVTAGNGVLALCSPLLQRIGFVGEYAALLQLYVLCANLHALCGAMAQALGRVRLYAATGVLCTALVVGLNILLLSVLRMGVAGYILSNVIADAVSAAALFFALRLWRSIRLRALPRSLLRGMLRYCLPLIPATVCTWIINISDRYFLTDVLGSDVSGLYALANKVASILLIASGIFTSAWNLSIAAGRSRAEKERFFSNAFSVYEACVWTAAAALMASCRLIVRFLAAPGYFSAWRYAPVLILATAVACLGSFFSSVYVAEKRSAATLATSAAGALGNLVGNALLIPRWGAMGAAVATLLSYLLIFLARALHAQRLLRIRWAVPRSLLCAAILAWGAGSCRASASRRPCCAARPSRCSAPGRSCARCGTACSLCAAAAGETPKKATAIRKPSPRGPADRGCLSVTPGSARCPPSSRGSGPRSPAGHRRPSC